MKPARPALATVIEPLEARIAPAAIYIGAQGLFENIKDTEYHEVVNPFVHGQDAPRPDGFNQLTFTDTKTSTDPLSLSLGATSGNTYFLQLKKGDYVRRFSQTNGYNELGDPFINVTAGNVIAFFTDLNNNNEFDDGELTGLALGKGAVVAVNGSVNGDIASNLNEHNTKEVADDTIDTVGLVSTKQGITNLRVLGGSVLGTVFSAGDIKNTQFANNVDAILAGTATSGQSFDFFTGSTGGKGSFAVAPAAGITGASISNLNVKSLTTRIEAGTGGAGGKGGSLSNIQVTSDTDGFALLAGDGGEGDSGAKKLNGGSGGTVSNVVVGGVLDPTPSSPLGILIGGGTGGDGLSNGLGGAGGAVSKIRVGYENAASGLVESGSLLSDSVSIFGGGGGAGKTGGLGGSVSDVKVRVRTPEVNGVEIAVVAGDGGSSLSPLGKAGAGGSAKTLDLRNQSIVDGTDVLVQSGRGGSTVGAGIGAPGGSISGVTSLSFDHQYVAGNGSDGKTGGVGGSITGVTLLSDESVRAHNLLIDAGKGGDGTVGNGGNAGNISFVRGDVVDLATLIMNSGVKGNGGDSVASLTAPGLKGGKGGSISNLTIGDTDSDARNQGTAIIRTGLGGDGDKGGGAGGNLSVIDVSATDLSFEINTGDGGSATLKGKGGAAGTVVNAQFLSGGANGLIPVHGFIQSGQGGDGKGANGAGGAGGNLSGLRVSVAGDAKVIAGNGGSGEASVGVVGGAAGSGGSLLAVGMFATTGSGTMRAGDGGALGVKPGNGGTIKGENVSKDPNAEPQTIIGVRASTSISIIAGNGTHGGNGGDITGITYGSTAQILLPTPNGSIYVQAGSGSAEGKAAGRGGSIDRLDGSVSSGVNQTTTIVAGDGGGFVGAVKAGAGGSVRNSSLSRGGSSGGLLTIKAGDAGDASAGATGAAGGSVQNVDVTNIDPLTNFRSVAAGDGGDGLKKGGLGGSVQGLRVQAHDIGARTGQVFGYTTQGGIFAGVGGAVGPGGKVGLNGNVIDVSADAIASIVAGRTATPQLVEKAASIKVNGDFSTLLYNLNAIFPGTGSFQIRFGPNPGDITTILPANATAQEVQDALNAAPAIQTQGGVAVTSDPSLGYRVRWNNPANRDELLGIETVSAEVTEQIKGALGNGSTSEVTSGEVDFNAVETRSGEGSLKLLETTPGAQFLGSTEVVSAVPGVSGETQQISTAFLAAFPTGSFNLTFNGETTAFTLPNSASALDIENALNSMTTITNEGGVTVQDGPLPRTFLITFAVSTTPENPISGTFFVPETQRLDLSPISPIVGSTFTLTYLGVTTGLIPSTANATDIQNAMNAIVAPETVTVSPFSPGIFDITFNLPGDHTEILSKTQVPEIQTVTLGSFANQPPAQSELKLFYGAESTVALPPNPTAAQVDAALEALPSIGANNVTVVAAPNNSFVITFATNGQKLDLFGVGKLQEHQRLDLSAFSNSTTTEFSLQATTYANVIEGPRGVATALPTATSVNGLIGPLIAITTDPGSGQNAEIQYVQIPSLILQKPGAEFYLNFGNQQTIFLPVTATDVDVQAALNALPNIGLGVTVQELLPGAFSITFIAQADVPQITGFAGLREVQTLNTSALTGQPGAQLTLSLGNGEITPPLAAPTDIPSLTAAISALPDFALLKGVTVTQPTPDHFTIVANDFGNVAQLAGLGGSPADHESQTIDLSAYAGVTDAVLNLAFGTDTTPIIPVTATAANIEAALNALPSVQNLQANGGGAVTVTETAPGSHIFKVDFNIFGNQPAIVGTLGLDDPATAGLAFKFTDRLPHNATPNQVETALEAAGLQGVTVTAGALPGVYEIVYDQLGNQPSSATFTSTHEQQKLDVYGIGNFVAIFDSQPQTVDLNPATVGLNDLPEGATAADVQTALLSIAAIQALPLVKAGQSPLTVVANPDSSYTVVFDNVDGDVAFLGGDQFENFTVHTIQDGSSTPGNLISEVQIITPIVKGEFLSAAFAKASLVGAIVDINEIDSNVFKFIHLGTTYSAAQRDFEIGDTPIDGILLAKNFDQSTCNFTPEARLTAAGFFDNDNLIS